MSEPVKPELKIVAIRFVHPVHFSGVNEQLRVGLSVDSVTRQDGGVMLQRRTKDPMSATHVVKRAWVPLSNVSEITYEDVK